MPDTHEPHAAAQAAWEAFLSAYDEYQTNSAGWRARWSDHHAYALGAALRAYDVALVQEDIDTIEIGEITE